MKSLVRLCKAFLFLALVSNNFSHASESSGSNPFNFKTSTLESLPLRYRYPTEASHVRSSANLLVQVFHEAGIPKEHIRDYITNVIFAGKIDDLASFLSNNGSKSLVDSMTPKPIRNILKIFLSRGAIGPCFSDNNPLSEVIAWFITPILKDTAVAVSTDTLDQVLAQAFSFLESQSQQAGISSRGTNYVKAKVVGTRPTRWLVSWVNPQIDHLGQMMQPPQHKLGGIGLLLKRLAKSRRVLGIVPSALQDDLVVHLSSSPMATLKSLKDLREDVRDELKDLQRGLINASISSVGLLMGSSLHLGAKWNVFNSGLYTRLYYPFADGIGLDGLNTSMNWLLLPALLVKGADYGLKAALSPSLPPKDRGIAILQAGGYTVLIYGVWNYGKDVVGSVASFLSHQAHAAKTSVIGRKLSPFLEKLCLPGDVVTVFSIN